MKKINTWVKVLVLLCLTAIGGYGIFMAPGSDQSEMEQELRRNEAELQSDDISDSPGAVKEDKTEIPETTEEPEGIVTVIGDSVFLGAAPSFKKIQKNAVVDAKISRQVRHGLEAAKNLNKKHKLGDTVIISLGTNGPFNPATGQELIDYLGQRTIYWVNAYGKNLEFQQDVNRTIQDLVKKNENVHLIPWAKEAKKHPDWFYQDGTHLNAKGQPGFAQFVQGFCTEDAD